MNTLLNKLKQELLGSFDLISTSRIYHNQDDIVSATYVHEESHRKLFSSTSFGEIQQILAYLLNNNSSNVSLEWINKVSDFLSYTINLSVCVHEGYAVWRQIEYGNLFSYYSDVKLMPQTL